MIHMADATNFSLNKEWDLNFIYDMAKKARSSGEIKQSIKLSEKGLEEAKKANDKNMILKFNTFHSEIYENYLRKKIERYTKRGNLEGNIYRYEKAIQFLKKAKKKLNKLFKLGKNEAKIRKQIKLIDKNISEFKEKERLSNLEIISDEEISDKEANVNKIVVDAEDLQYVDDLNHISEEEDKINFDEYEEIEQKVENPEESIESDLILKPEPKKNDENKFEISIEKKQIDETNSIIKSFLHSEEIKSENYRPKSVKLASEKNPEKIDLERLNQTTHKALIKDTKNMLNSLDYYIIPGTLHLIKKTFEFLDIIAVKLIYINDFLNIIKILPLRISNLKGSFLVSENDINYHPFNRKLKIDKLNKELLIDSEIFELKKISDLIFQDIINEGDFFTFFKKYLKLDIDIEKTTGSQRLFFHCGPIQYKVLIEPIIVSQNEPGFIEKSIPFSYQKKSNLHIIELAKLRNLLQFLEKKCIIIESNSENPNTINTYFDTIEKFSIDLKLYSIPFVIFGFIFLLIIIFQAQPIITVFIDIGYSVIFIYSILLFYLYLRFYKKKRELIEDFKTPYYQKNISIEESDLLMIRSEFSKEMMNQFLYECFEKKTTITSISKLEDEFEYNQFEENKPNQNEGEIQYKSEKNDDLKSFASNKYENTLIEKYSTFLED